MVVVGGRGGIGGGGDGGRIYPHLHFGSKEGPTLSVGLSLT